MPNARLLLWFALAGILYFNYEAWMHDYPAAGTPGALQRSAGGAPGGAGSLGDSVPQAASTASTATVAPQAAPAPASIPAALDSRDASPSAQLHVSTDVLDIDINLKGGELDQADLKEYPQRKDTPNIPVRLLNRDPQYLLQTGLLGAARTDALPAPRHHPTHSAPPSMNCACH